MADERHRHELNDRDRMRNTAAGDDDLAERERIAQRAYERFKARGEEHGRDQEDWFEAERESRSRSRE